MRRRPMLAVVAAAATVPLLASCYVTEATPERIAVQHNANHPWAAELIATRHCETGGRVPVWAGSTVPAPRLYTLLTVGTESTYDCVDPTEAPARRFPDPPPAPGFED